jgi:uncharacterized protein YciI
MLWIIHCRDRPGTAAQRQELRPEHSSRLRAADDSVRPVCYGPLVADDGTAVGSLIVVEAADRATVQRWLAQDPFAREGVWSTTSIDGFTQSTSSPVQLATRQPTRQ